MAMFSQIHPIKNPVTRLYVIQRKSFENHLASMKLHRGWWRSFVRIVALTPVKVYLLKLNSIYLKLKYPKYSIGSKTQEIFLLTSFFSF